MTHATALAFGYGALTACSAIAALFFLRFWAHVRDRIFLFLAAGFAALGLSWGALALLPPSGEHREGIYVVRLVAFVVILVGVVDKNRRG